MAWLSFAFVFGRCCNARVGSAAVATVESMLAALGLLKGAKGSQTLVAKPKAVLTRIA